MEWGFRKMEWKFETNEKKDLGKHNGKWENEKKDLGQMEWEFGTNGMGILRNISNWKMVTGLLLSIF